MHNTIQIGILEDHIATADGYKAKLEKNSRLSVSWVANYYQEVETALKNQPTDLLILDIEVRNNPETSEPFPILHAIPQLLEIYPEIKIVVISMYNRPVLIKAVKSAGASGYILKDDVKSYEKLDEILTAIFDHDSIYFSHEAARVLKNTIEWPSLTPRQNEILSLIASNPTMKTKELAEKLFVSPSTIRNHLADIYIKLGVNSRSSSILRAQQLGLIAVNTDKLPLNGDEFSPE